MKNVQQSIHAAIVIGAGILLLIFIKAPSEDKQKSNFAVSSKSVSMTKSPARPVASKAPKANVKKLAPTIEISPSPAKRLIRFGELNGKVLLSFDESTEKGAILSDPKMIEWVSFHLTKVDGVKDFKDRLSMIDFLEESVIWKGNPIRENVALAISDVILSETFLSATHDVKRQLVGDKIELFTILTEQTPEKSAQLLSKVQGTKLEPILNYATRRLPVNAIKTEVRQ